MTDPEHGDFVLQAVFERLHGQHHTDAPPDVSQFVPLPGMATQTVLLGGQRFNQPQVALTMSRYDGAGFPVPLFKALERYTLPLVGPILGANRKEAGQMACYMTPLFSQFINLELL